jgi:hypothetical protein
VSTGTSRSQNAHKIFVSVSSRKRWPLAAADPSPSPPPTPRPQGTLSHPPLSRRIYHLHAPLPCPRPALIHRQAPITPTNLDQQNRATAIEGCTYGSCASSSGKSMWGAPMILFFSLETKLLYVSLLRPSLLRPSPHFRPFLEKHNMVEKSIYDSDSV